MELGSAHIHKNVVSAVAVLEMHVPFGGDLHQHKLTSIGETVSPIAAIDLMAFEQGREIFEVLVNFDLSNHWFLPFLSAQLGTDLTAAIERAVIGYGVGDGSPSELEHWPRVEGDGLFAVLDELFVGANLSEGEFSPHHFGGPQSAVVEHQNGRKLVLDLLNGHFYLPIPNCICQPLVYFGGHHELFSW